MPVAGKLIVRLKRGLAGKPEAQKRIVYSLGLRKTGATHELPDNPAIRGMIEKVKHLIEVTEA